MKTTFLLFSGNLNQNNSIVIRYHGILTENSSNDSTKFSMFYYFDQAENDKKIIELQKCTKCIGDCFCATLDLDTNHTLHFGFFNGNNYELNNNTAFKLEIAPDPIANIMQRYGFEHNNNLPTYEEKNDKMFALQNIFATIKNFFKKIFNKNVPV